MPLFSDVAKLDDQISTHFRLSHSLLLLVQNWLEGE